MLTVANGMGVNSIAMLVGLKKRGIRPDRILHAAVGSEKRKTYAYFDVLGPWLEKVGFPPCTVVKYVPVRFKNWPPYYTLLENCLTNGTMPSIAFGKTRFKGACSSKWKQTPQHKFLQNDVDALAVWASGRKIQKAIGFDCSARDKQRRQEADKKLCTYSDDKEEWYEYLYLLQEWGWDRERCESEIISEGLSVPVKSSCYFCLAMKEAEVRELEPDELRCIVLLEARATPRLREGSSVKGLWCSKTMTDFIRAEGLLTKEDIERIQTVPAELVRFQEAFAAGTDRVPLGVWLQREFPEIYPPDPTNCNVVEIGYEPEPEMQASLFPIVDDSTPILEW